jgi:hypothetical protein
MIALLIVKLGFSHYPMKEDMRALEASLRERLPDVPYEIISVNDHLESLGFYNIHHVERVSALERPYPFFIIPRPLREKIAHMKTSDYAHVFVCREDWQAQVVRDCLHQAGVSCEETRIPFFYTRVFICPPIRLEPHLVRLIVLPDPGTGKSRRQSIASALHLLNVEKYLNGGVLVLPDPPEPGRGDARDSTPSHRKDFEQLFAGLRALNVPLHTLPRDWDPNQIQGSAPPLQASPPGSGSFAFGDGMVELFFPESNAQADRPSGPDRFRRKGLSASLRESRALWKIGAIPDPFPGNALPGPPLLFDEEPGPLMLQSGARIVLQGNRCFLKHPVVDPQAPRPVAPVLPITGPDPNVAYRMLEFDRSVCRITAFDLVGTPLATFTLPAP